MPRCIYDGTVILYLLRELPLAGGDLMTLDGTVILYSLRELPLAGGDLMMLLTCA
jgi:hypothetical protein